MKIYAGWIGCILSLSIGVVVPVLASEDGRIYSKSDVLNIVDRHLRMSIDKVLFLKPNGEPDPRFVEDHKADNEEFVRKATLLREMIHEILQALDHETYTESFVEKAKKDTVEFARANKDLILCDLEEFMSAKEVITKKASAFLNQDPIDPVDFDKMRDRYFEDLDYIAGEIKELLLAGNIVCPEAMVPKSVVAICTELSGDNVVQHALLVKYYRMYCSDMVEMGVRKLRNDFGLVTGNLYYGTEGARVLQGGHRRDTNDVSDFIRNALCGKSSQVLFGELKGSIWGLMYDALQYSYAENGDALGLERKYEMTRRSRSKLLDSGTVKQFQTGPGKLKRSGPPGAGRENRK